MKKILMLAAVFGVMFATESFAGKKGFKNATPEQKAEWAQKKEERIQKCMEMGKSEEKCKEMAMKKKGDKGDKARAGKIGKEGKIGKNWENLTEEQKAEFKKHKEAKYAKCLEAGKSETECKEMKMKKDGDCMKGKIEAGEAVAVTEEAPAKKRWWTLGLF